MNNSQPFADQFGRDSALEKMLPSQFIIPVHEINGRSNLLQDDQVWSISSDDDLKIGHWPFIQIKNLSLLFTHKFQDK
jgi:hypothetical protein